MYNALNAFITYSVPFFQAKLSLEPDPIQFAPILEIIKDIFSFNKNDLRVQAHKKHHHDYFLRTHLYLLNHHQALDLCMKKSLQYWYRYRYCKLNNHQTPQVW